MPLPPAMPGSVALVTGASSGIGSHIARVLADRGQDVVLVARREDLLDELAGELRAAHGRRVEVLACDLGDADARAALPDRVADLGLTVEVLVNNAGFGSGGAFVELDPEREAKMVELNCGAVTHLCGLWAPGMARRGRGAILNVASSSAFQPVPGMSTYAATKAFVLSLSESLHQELGARGVTVTALCPGPVHTEFAGEAALDGAASKLPALVWTDVESVAEQAVRGVEAGKRAVVPGRLHRAGAVGGQHMPRAALLRVVGALASRAR